MSPRNPQNHLKTTLNHPKTNPKPSQNLLNNSSFHPSSATLKLLNKKLQVLEQGTLDFLRILGVVLGVLWVVLGLLEVLLEVLQVVLEVLEVVLVVLEVVLVVLELVLGSEPLIFLNQCFLKQ